MNRKKIREIKFGNFTRSKFGPRCLLAQGALLRHYIGAGIPIFDSYLAFLNQIQNEQFAAFFLFMGTSPKDCALLGGNGNTLKSKLDGKQTSIATVRDLYRMYATFLNPRPPWFSLQTTGTL